MSLPERLTAVAPAHPFQNYRLIPVLTRIHNRDPRLHQPHLRRRQPEFPQFRPQLRLLVCLSLAGFLERTGLHNYFANGLQGSLGQLTRSRCSTLHHELKKGLQDRLSEGGVDPWQIQREKQEQDGQVDVPGVRGGGCDDERYGE